MPTSPEFFPKYPIYIVSKGRWKSRHTAKALDNLGIPYYVAVEDHEYDNYAEVLGIDKVLAMPFSNHGKGSGPARNWVWDHSMANGFDRHWVLDDNITEFWRWNYNQRIRLESGSLFRSIEDFVDRYENVRLAGPQYKFFAIDDYKYPPFLINTRLMSCILVDNSLKHRWRCRYNEDVDISLRVLKDGDVTMLFYHLLQGKMRTGTVKGGNTTEIYGNGTFNKSKMLADLHPDCVRLVKRYGRWHHHVDLSRFRNNKLIPKEGIEIPQGTNNYGLKFVQDYGLPTQHFADRPKSRGGRIA